MKTWAQNCSCGGVGIIHLHAEHHEPTGPAVTDPFAGRACPLCGDYVTGPCPACASFAIAALVRVRELHHPASYPDPNGPGEITYCVGCEEGDGGHPCPTINALTPPADQPDGDTPATRRSISPAASETTRQQGGGEVR